MASIFSLSQDMIHKIYEGLGSSDILSLRSANQWGKDAADTTLKALWLKLMSDPPKGAVDLLSKMRVIDEGGTEKGVLSFRKLTEEFAKIGVVIPGKLAITAPEFKDLQDRAAAQDRALVTIWPAITISLSNYQAVSTLSNELQLRPGKRFTAKEIQDSAKKIRDWLNVPPNTTFLGEIIELDLSNQRLKSLPDEIGICTRLEYLFLPNNALKCLPNKIGSLINLKLLDLSGNLLQGLPVVIGNLTQLKGLGLFNNQIERLPDTMRSLTSLSNVDLSGNPLMDVPAGLSGPLATACNEAMLNFKKELKYSSKSPLAKLYQAMIQKKPKKEVQEAFSSLGTDDKNKISERICGYSGSAEAVNRNGANGKVPVDMDVLYLAVREVIILKRRDLSADEEQQIFKNIYKLGEDQITDQEIFEILLTCGNLPLLADLIELIKGV